MHSTDNIIISSFVGVVSIGLYSNYTLITQTMGSLVNQALNSFSESVGNLIASERPEKIYQVFQVIFFLNFLVVSIPLVIIYNTINPFVCWWLGERYLLGELTLYVILLNFYIDNMRSSALTFKTKSGIFVKDRFTPLFQGIINLLLSLLFVQWWGLTGVLFATTISLLSIGFWQFPRLCYKYTFHQPLYNYFRKYIVYTITWGASLLLSCVVCSIFQVDHLFLKAIINGTISLATVLIIYFITFYKTEQSRMLMQYAKFVIKTHA